MSQKSNLLTLRNPSINQSFKSSLKNPKDTIFFLDFFKLLFMLFEKKHVYLLKFVVKEKNSSIFIKLSLFYTTKKLSIYKKSETCFIENKTSIQNNLSFLEILKSYFNHYKKFLYIYKISIINKTFNSCFLNTSILFYTNLKKYLSSLFIRRYTFFLDFLKIISLYFYQKITTSFFLYFLSLIFKNLSKKYHTKFFKFLLDLFKIFVKLPSSKIKGLKYRICGKLKGKLRSNTSVIRFGLMPHNSISKTISYSSCHVFTKIGVFGMKLWTFYNK